MIATITTTFFQPPHQQGNKFEVVVQVLRNWQRWRRVRTLHCFCSWASGPLRWLTLVATVRAVIALAIRGARPAPRGAPVVPRRAKRASNTVGEMAASPTETATAPALAITTTMVPAGALTMVPAGAAAAFASSFLRPVALKCERSLHLVRACR